MLYDDEEQLEVRHVISLAHHGVDIYGGGEVIPEGELFVKRNSIRLSSRRVYGEVSQESRPFYLFSENCSNKEDFYFALLQNQERKPGSADNPPTPLPFEQAHLIKLVQQLHVSEENLQTRWFNAMLGRVFLSLYKTNELEDFIRTKINKKISRVQKPSFLESVAVGQIHLGDAAPMITNPKLRELTMDGDVTIEADVKYNGRFRLEILATARIDLGSRIKAREISLLLAGILKKLEGHVIFRIKPPPSNRVWFSFETAPKMELSIEPVVSQRQITYGFILRQIENRIREVVGETLVNPNWDDVPFSQTLLQRYRGGLWEDDQKPTSPLEPSPPFVESTTEGTEDLIEEKLASMDDSTSEISIPPMLPERGKVMSTPFLANTAPSRLTARNEASRSTASVDTTALSSGVELSKDGSSGRPSSANVNGSSAPPSPPKVLRSNSFASPTGASPMLTRDPATFDNVSPGRGTPIPVPGAAAAAMKDITAAQQQQSRNSSRSISLNASPKESPIGSLERSTESAEYMAQAAAAMRRGKNQSVGSVKSNSSPTNGVSAAVYGAASAAEANARQSSSSHLSELSARPGSSSSAKQQNNMSTSAHSRTDSTDIATSDGASSISTAETETSPKAGKRSSATAKKMLANATANKSQTLNTATAAAKRWGLGIMASRRNAKPAAHADAKPDVNEATPQAETEKVERDPSQARLSDKPSQSSLGSSANVNSGELARSSSPSSIPRRISSQSLSSSASSSAGTAVPPRAPTPSKIPTPNRKPSSSSLRNAMSPTRADSPSLGPTSSPSSSPQLAQSTLPRPKTDAHSRKPSLSSIPHGPGSPLQPMGRGQPLPPPGTPLPGPQRSGTWTGAMTASASALMNMGMNMRRKPVGSGNNSVDSGRPQGDAEDKDADQEEEKDETQEPRSPPPPPLPRRPLTARGASQDEHGGLNGLGIMDGSGSGKRQSSIKKRPVPKSPLPKRNLRASEVPSEGPRDAEETLPAEIPQDNPRHEKGHGEAEDDYGAWEENTDDAEVGDVEANEKMPNSEARDEGHDEHEEGGASHTDEEETFGPMEMNIEDMGRGQKHGDVAESARDHSPVHTAGKEDLNDDDRDVDEEDGNAWAAWESDNGPEDRNKARGEGLGQEKAQTVSS